MHTLIKCSWFCLVYQTDLVPSPPPGGRPPGIDPDLRPGLHNLFC